MGDEAPRNCNVCNEVVGDAHTCVKCLKPVHVICGEGIGEEGYGQLVTCKKCNVIKETSTQAKGTETSTETLDLVPDETYDDLDDSPILLEHNLNLMNSQEIPKNIWGLIPSCGEYLIEIMKFSGYDEIDSVLQLKEDEERKKMFDFVKEMIDVVEDRDKTFGIFATVPDKVRVLPGLEKKFEDFLNAVEKLRNPKKTVEKGNRKRPNDKEKPKQAVVKPEKNPRTETSDTLKHQMNQWLKKKNMIKGFKFSTNSSGNFVFVCEECGIEKISSSGKIACSNAQKHYRDGICKKMVESKKNGAVRFTIQSAFSKSNSE